MNLQKRFERKMEKDRSTLLKLKTEGHTIAAFGAAAKGIMYVNMLGLSNETISFCVDETPEKIGKFLPGSKIKIMDMNFLKDYKPKFLLILPHNFKDEIIEKTSFIKKWNGEHLCLT